MSAGVDFPLQGPWQFSI